MDKTVTRGNIGVASVAVGLEFHKTIDYDKREMRKALSTGAGAVAKEAKRLVSRRAISGAGELPGRRSGVLRRAIGVVSKGTKGGWIKVGVKKTAEMAAKNPNSKKWKGAFYPAFLYYGSPKMDARKNYIVEALDNKRDAVRSAIKAALKNALVPR